MADLSPAAQAVYNAVLEICSAPVDEIAVAALRAAADQVGEWESAEELRAIAAELEGQ